MFERPKVELRLQIEQQFFLNLMAKLNISSPGEVVRMALALENWMFDEARKGRVILSSRPDGTEVHHLVMPGLN